MNCPACGFNLRKDFRYCPSCGTEIPKTIEDTTQTSADRVIICDVCGEENSVSSNHCSSCGAKLGQQITTNKTFPSQKVAKKEQKGNRENDSYKKENRSKQETIKSTKSLSPVNIVVLVFGLLLLGYIILDIAGIFDTPVNQVTNPTPQKGAPLEGTKQIDLTELQRIDDLEKLVIADTTKTDLILELAHKLGDSGFHERAIKYYEIYLRQNPNNADVNVDLGVIFFEMKQYNKAKFRMMKGLAFNPSHQIAHFNIGVVNSSEGKMDSAKIWWKRAVEINPATEIGRRAQELLNSH